MTTLTQSLSIFRVFATASITPSINFSFSFLLLGSISILTTGILSLLLNFAQRAHGAHADARKAVNAFAVINLNAHLIKFYAVFRADRYACAAVAAFLPIYRNAHKNHKNRGNKAIKT